MALMLATAGRSLSSHDHLLRAVTVWMAGFPFWPAAAGRVEVANMSSSERRGEKSGQRLVAARSIHGQAEVSRLGLHVQRQCGSGERCRQRCEVEVKTEALDRACARCAGRRKARPTFRWSVHLPAAPPSNALHHHPLYVPQHTLLAHGNVAQRPFRGQLRDMPVCNHGSRCHGALQPRQF